MNSLVANRVIEHMEADACRAEASAQFERAIRVHSEAASMYSECVKAVEQCTARAEAALLRFTQNLPASSSPIILPPFSGVTKNKMTHLRAIGPHSGF